MSVYGYIRILPFRPIEQAHQQQESLELYAMRSLDSGLLDVFVDQCNRKVPLRYRDGAQKLMRRLRRGDHVVIQRMDVLFDTTEDVRPVFRPWSMLGITLHLATLGLARVAIPAKFVLLALGYERKLRENWPPLDAEALAASEELRRKIMARFPEQEFQDAMNFKAVGDAETLPPIHAELMRILLKWRDEGLSYSTICSRAERANFRNPTTGRPYSRSRIVHLTKLVEQYRDRGLLTCAALAPEGAGPSASTLPDRTASNTKAHVADLEIRIAAASNRRSSDIR